MNVCAYAESTTTTNMSKNKGASRFKPRYDCFERSRDSPYTASVTDRTSKEVRDDPLAGYKAWPAGAKKKDPEFVEMNKTLRTTAEECLAEFRYNFISVTLDRVPHNEKENETQLEDMFADDLLGLKTVPYNNVLCWSMRNVADVSASAVPSSPAKSAETSKPPKKRGGKKSEKKHKKKKRREKKRKKKLEEASVAASATPETEDTILGNLFT